jgi:hypothetical protein
MGEEEDSGIIQEKDIQCVSSKAKVFTELVRSMAVSEDGNFLWGIHITEALKSTLIRVSFENGEVLTYSHEHKKVAFAVMVSEEFGVAMTGGNDQRVVVHDLWSGLVRRIIQTPKCRVHCLFALGRCAVIVQKKRVRFFDLVEGDYVQDEPTVELKENVKCMQLAVKKSKGEKELVLLLAGKSPKLKEVKIKPNIRDKSKFVLGTPNTESLSILLGKSCCRSSGSSQRRTRNLKRN